LFSYDNVGLSNLVHTRNRGLNTLALTSTGLLISTQTGLLVKSGDVQTLAEGLFKVLENEELRWRLSGNVLKYSRTFSWDKAAYEFMKNVEEKMFVRGSNSE